MSWLIIVIALILLFLLYQYNKNIFVNNANNNDPVNTQLSAAPDTNRSVIIDKPAHIIPNNSSMCYNSCGLSSGSIYMPPSPPFKRPYRMDLYGPDGSRGLNEFNDSTMTQVGGAISSPRNYLVYANGNTIDPNNSYAMLTNVNGEPEPTLEYLQNEYNILRTRAEIMDLTPDDMQRLKKLQDTIMRLEAQLQLSGLRLGPMQLPYKKGLCTGSQTGGYIDSRMGSDVLTGTGSGPPISPVLGPLPGAPIAPSVSTLGSLKNSLTNLLSMVYQIPNEYDLGGVAPNLTSYRPVVGANADPYYGVPSAAQKSAASLAQTLATGINNYYNTVQTNAASIDVNTLANNASKLAYLSQILSSRLSADGNQMLAQKQAQITNTLQSITPNVSQPQLLQISQQLMTAQQSILQALGGSTTNNMQVTPNPSPTVFQGQPQQQQQPQTTTAPVMPSNTQQGNAPGYGQGGRGRGGQGRGGQGQGIGKGPGMGPGMGSGVPTQQTNTTQPLAGQTPNLGIPASGVGPSVALNPNAPSTTTTTTTVTPTPTMTSNPTVPITTTTAPTMTVTTTSNTPITTNTSPMVPTIQTTPSNTQTSTGNFVHQPRTIPMPPYATNLPDEQRWLNAINFYRNINCVAPLTWDPNLANLAQSWGNVLAALPPASQGPPPIANIYHPNQTQAQTQQYLTLASDSNNGFGGQLGQNIAWGGPDVIGSGNQPSYRKEIEDVVADWYEEVNLPNVPIPDGAGFETDSNGNITFTPTIAQRQSEIQDYFNQNASQLSGCPPGITYKYGSPENCNPETGHMSQLVWKNTSQVGCVKVPHMTIPNTYIWLCNFSPPGNVTGEYLQNVLDPKTCPNGYTSS